MANLRKRLWLFITMLLLFVAFMPNEVKSQGITKIDTVGTSDSTYYVYLGTAAKQYKYCRTTLRNPSATLQDSLRLFHVTKFALSNGTRDSTYTRIGFKKLSINGQDVQNDTIYYVVTLPAATSMEVLVWFPFPEAILWDMHAVYAANRRCWIKNNFTNE